MQRRNFLLAGLAGAISTFGGRLANAAAKKPAGAFVKISALKQGQPQLVRSTFKGQPRNVWVTASGKRYSVLDATCTHEGCLVQGLEPAGLRCSCHQALYRPTDGEVLGGPAPRPLAKVAFQVKNGYLCFK